MSKPYSSKPLKALLFDLDGTLTDTSEFHFKASVDALDQFGLTLDRSVYFDVIHGNNNKSIAEYFFPKGDHELHQNYTNKKEQFFRNYLINLTPVDGLMDLLSWARQSSLLMALVTAAPKENKDASLRALGLEDTFDVVILGDDLERNKPDPLPYQTALNRLGVQADEAIGFEDSLHGVESVSGAGVYTVGVTSTLAASPLLLNGADITIYNYTDDTLWKQLKKNCSSLVELI